MSAGNLVLVPVNLADRGTIAADPAMVANLPPEYLLQQGRSFVARSTSTDPQAIAGNLEAAAMVDALALCGHNLSGGATIRWRLYSEADQGGSLTYDSGALAVGTVIPWGSFDWGVGHSWGATYEEGAGDQYAIHLMAAPKVCGSWQVDITDGDNPDGYMEARRLVIGRAFRPQCNASYGLQWGWVSQTAHQRTAAGSLDSEIGPRYRTLSFALNYLYEAERATLARQITEPAEEVLVVVFPSEATSSRRFADYSFLGKVDQLPPYTLASYRSIQAEFRIEET
jgi:hypothetical protein